MNFFDIFPEKPSQIKFDTIIPSSSGRAVPCGWTGTMKLNLFSLCWESAYKCAIFPPFSGMSSYRSVRHADNSLSLLTFLKAKQKKRPSYISCNIMMRSRNHFCSGNATMRPVCISELSVTVNNIIKCCKKILSQRIHVAYHIKTYFV